LVFAFPRSWAGIYAFPADCGTENATCRPIWSWGTGTDARPGRSVQAAVVAGDYLYVAVTGLPRGGTVNRGGSKVYVFGITHQASG
jgi:hypothetical protein